MNVFLIEITVRYSEAALSSKDGILGLRADL